MPPSSGPASTVPELPLELELDEAAVEAADPLEDEEAERLLCVEDEVLVDVAELALLESVLLEKVLAPLEVEVTEELLEPLSPLEEPAPDEAPLPELDALEAVVADEVELAV